MTWGDRKKVQRLFIALHDAYDRNSRGADVQESLIAITALAGEIIGTVPDAERRQKVRDEFVKAVDIYVAGRAKADDEAAAAKRLPGLGGKDG